MIAPGEGYVLVVRFYINVDCFQMLWRRPLHFPLLTTLFPPLAPGPPKSLIAMVFWKEKRARGRGNCPFPIAVQFLPPPPQGMGSPTGAGASSRYLLGEPGALTWRAALKNGRAARSLAASALSARSPHQPIV